MRYLHTMVRVKDLEASLHFYCELFGLTEIRRYENEKGRFTLVFLSAEKDLGRARELDRGRRKEPQEAPRERHNQRHMRIGQDVAHLAEVSPRHDVDSDVTVRHGHAIVHAG